MKTVLVTTSSFADEASELMEILRSHKLRIVTNPFRRRLTTEELQNLIEKCKPVGLLAGTETITRSVLAHAKDFMRIISRVGVGWDNIDQAAAAEFNIRVYRTSGVLAQAVAELTIGLMIGALRNIPLQDRLLRRKIWKKQMGGLIQGRVVGVIGFGSIGKRVGELVKAFGAQVIYSDPIVSDVSWAKSVGMVDLIRQADIITIHANGTDRILGRDEINQCKRGVIIINTARAELVDQDALQDALENGRIGYACLDVFIEEPYSGSLLDCDNVVLTPHIGSYAREARILMETRAVENLLTGLKALGII